MPQTRSTHGFTLIEILVATTILAIMALVVGIGLSGLGGDRELEQEAERLHKRIDFACETALLDGRSIGMVQLADGGYRFLERIAGQWRPVAGRPSLAPHHLSPAIRLTLRREDRDLPLAERDDAAVQPQLACLASGELTPFVAELEASGANQRFTITGYIDMQTEIKHAPLSP